MANRKSTVIDEDAYYNTRVDWQSIPRSKAFVECMKYFDESDKTTRSILLSINEADQNMVMQTLASKFYSYIISKVDKIDFGRIPFSKGDIRKVEKFDQLQECLGILGQILQNYKQPIEDVDTVNIAVQNMIDRTDLFVKAYRLNVEMPIVAYNTLVLSIYSSVSLLITSHIEFIKMGDNAGYRIAVDTASRSHTKNRLLFDNLKKFNNMCAKGDFDKTMDFVMKNSVAKRESANVSDAPEPQPMQEVAGGAAALFNGLATAVAAPVQGALGLAQSAGSAIASFASAHPWLVIGGVIIAALFLLIQLIRNLIYYFYYKRTEWSDDCDNMSSLLYMNSMNMQNSLTRDDKTRKEIAGKQNKIAEFFKKLGNKLRISDGSAESNASKEIQKIDSQKFRYEDLSNQIPASAKTSLF